MEVAALVVMVVEMVEAGIKVEMADVGRWTSGWRWRTWGGGRQGGDGGRGEVGVSVEMADVGRCESGWSGGQQTQVSTLVQGPLFRAAPSTGHALRSQDQAGALDPMLQMHLPLVEIS